jgi:hypothetical protein
LAPESHPFKLRPFVVPHTLTRVAVQRPSPNSTTPRASRTTAAPPVCFLRCGVVLHQIRVYSIEFAALVLCLQRTSTCSARLPAKAPAELCADSYQQATTVVQATQFAPRRAFEQPIRPGAVIMLGQATASVGTSRPPDSRAPLASRSQPL